MKPNELYFRRNQGEWNWNVDFKVISYSSLWRTNLSLSSKFRVSAFDLTQKLFGRFQMWTNVNFRTGRNSVEHSTRLKKWGLTFYRSEKEFDLAEDGKTLRLHGVEYFWPAMCVASPFSPMSGSVDESTTQAVYQMPLAGTSCDCRTYLDGRDAYIEIEAPGLKGRFELTEESKKILASRF